MLKGHHSCIGNNEEHDGALEVFVFDKSEEVFPPISWLNNFQWQSLVETDFLHFDPTFLLFSDKNVSKLFFFFNGIKVVNDYTHEKIDDELASNNHEHNEERY